MEKPPFFLIGDTSTHSWWIFQPAMLVYRSVYRSFWYCFCWVFFWLESRWWYQKTAWKRVAKWDPSTCKEAPITPLITPIKTHFFSAIKISGVPGYLHVTPNSALPGQSPCGPSSGPGCPQLLASRTPKDCAWEALQLCERGFLRQVGWFPTVPTVETPPWWKIMGYTQNDAEGKEDFPRFTFFHDFSASKRRIPGYTIWLSPIPLIMTTRSITIITNVL